jgi:hypothetical protein
VGNVGSTIFSQREPKWLAVSIVNLSGITQRRFLAPQMGHRSLTGIPSEGSEYGVSGRGFPGLAKVILTGEPVAAGLRAGGGERNYSSLDYR